MAIVVETGSGSATAESFASVAFADTYHSNRGNAAWAALLTAAKEAALRLGTDYIQSKYHSQWDGYRMTDAQALDWPRDYVVRGDSLSGTVYWPNNAVPNDVQVACVILADKSRTDTLMPDVDRATTKETVGAISVEYDKSASVEKKYAEVDRLLNKFFANKSSIVHKVVR